MEKYTDEELKEMAREKNREYKRKWREANKDKIREYNQRYWEKKALEAIEEEKEA